MTTRIGGWIIALVLPTFIGCSGPTDGADPDLGSIDATLTFAQRVNWPGVDKAAWREIPFLRGFSNGRPHAYWFLGFAARNTADSFWFCRESDTACPLDEHMRLNWDTLVGHPMFMRIPGQPGFSPFWQMWKVTVPDDFEPDSVKTIETLHRLDLEGAVRVESLVTDFGNVFNTYRGPQTTVLHCALVLEGTRLAEQGTEMPDGSAQMLVLERKFGWHQGYRVEFIDFSPSDGAFPEAEDSDSRPRMPFANIYIQWRRCLEGGTSPEICNFRGFAYRDRRPVSERGLGQDITGDGDINDTNNVLGALQCELRRPSERPYSPLWGPQAVMEMPGSALEYVDDYANQAESDIQSADQIFDAVAAGRVASPVVQREDETGNPVPGNEGQVFFNCPSPAPVGFVPFPCATP